MAKFYRLRLTIFGRILASYFIMFILVIVVSFVAVLNIYRFNKDIISVYVESSQMAHQTEGLRDMLAAAMRYEARYEGSRDQTVLTALLHRADEVRSALASLEAVARTSEEKELTAKIRVLYSRYLDLVRARIDAAEAGRGATPDRYLQEREALLSELSASVRLLSEQSSKARHEVIKELGSSQVRAANLSIVLSGASLLFGLTILYLLTRGITRSLSLIKQRTAEIASGNYGDALRLSSALEIEELAEALNVMAERLRALDEMKRDLLSMMSHELKAPLASIREGTHLLMRGGRDSTLTDDQQRLLSIVDDESRRMLDLVDSFLDVSRMEAGMMTFEFQSVDVDGLLQKALAELGPCVESKHLRVRVDYGRNIPPVHADKERLLQVFRNLIGNAVKFTPRGGQVTVACSVRDGSVEISVADTGPGIPKEHLETIFEKYTRVVPNGASSPKGAGLGLAIVKNRVTAHGGRVWAESEPGKGSIFRVSLPVTSPD